MRMKKMLVIASGLLWWVTATMAQQTTPNIIVIMSDDHDANAISAYNRSLIQTPQIDRLAQEGIRFTRAMVGNSLCGPSRATFLTGLHSNKNGFIDNNSVFNGAQRTLPKLLQDIGYQTALVGKWHLVSKPTGFDYWQVLPGQGIYYEPRMITQNGDTVTQHGYATNLISEHAIRWMREDRKPNKPFFLMLNHKAPHRYFLPTLANIQRFHTQQFPEPPTLYADTSDRGSAWRLQTMRILEHLELASDLKVDPAYLQDIPELKPSAAEEKYYYNIMKTIPANERELIKKIYAERGEIIRKERPTGNALLKLKYQWYMQDYLACVASIDENVGKVLNYLDSSGLAANTLVMYTSDQGFYLGQNGWFDKRWMYDVSMKTPLLIRWPGKIAPGTICNQLTQNIDHAPTLLEVAGIPAPKDMHGISLLPLLTNPQYQLPRKSVYYHFYEFKGAHTVLQHIGVRTARYKLIHFYTVNEWQLYDLLNDPEEQKNIYNVPAFESIQKGLEKELIALQKQYDDTNPAAPVK